MDIYNMCLWPKLIRSELYTKLDLGYHVNGQLCSLLLLGYSIPQGSVLSQKNYVKYTKPLGNITKHHWLEYHLYKDDTQVYLFFKPWSNAAQHVAIDCIEHCIVDTETRNCTITCWNLTLTKLKSCFLHPTTMPTTWKISHCLQVTWWYHQTLVWKSWNKLALYTDLVMHNWNICRIRWCLANDGRNSPIKGLVTTSRLD